MRTVLVLFLCVAASLAGRSGPVQCGGNVSPRSYASTGCRLSEAGVVCPAYEKRQVYFEDFSKESYGLLERRVSWAREGRPGTNCCFLKNKKAICSTIDFSAALGNHKHGALRSDVMAVIGGGPDVAFEWLKDLREKGDDVARKVLRKINDYDLANLAYLVLQKGGGMMDGSHKVGGEAFIFVLTSKLSNRKEALAGRASPRDAGRIDAIVGKLGGLGFIFQLFPTISRMIRLKGGAGSPSIDMPSSTEAVFSKLLQRKTESWYEFRPTFLMEERKFTPGDWKAYNAYADSVTRSTMREGQAIPLFDGGYVAAKGRAKVNMALVDTENGDLLAREIKPGEKLVLEDPESCFPRAIRDIKACQKDDPVYLSVYVYQSDEWARMFTDVLIDARKRGCDVQVIYDAVGSGLSDHKVHADGTVEQLPSTDVYYKKMRANGIPVVEWPAHSWKSDKISSHLNHRKLLIVGGGPNRIQPATAYAFLNVGTEYAAIWRDFSWRLEGPAIVDSMRLWQEQKNRVFYRLKKEELVKFDGRNPRTKFDVVYDFSSWKRGVLKDWETKRPTKFVYKTIRNVGHIGLEDIDIKTINIAAMKTAVNRIKVQCPYTTDRDFLEAMCDAGKRFRAAGKPFGSVVLLVPANNDMGVTKLALRTWYEKLLKSGVQIRENMDPMSHGKAKLFDDIVEGGSSNLDTRSLWNNDEQIAAVQDKKLADYVDKKIFHDATDRIVTMKDVQRFKDETVTWIKSQALRKIWMQL